MKKQFTGGGYVPPQVRACNIRIESGFVLSGPTDFIDPDYEGRTEE